MKAKKREARAKAAVPARRLWPWALGLFLAVFTVFEVYGPVLWGPFIFDDEYLPFRYPDFGRNLSAWVAGVRPMLMFTYWVNFRISAEETFLYHVFNVAFHLGGGVLLFFVLRRLLALAGTVGERGGLLAAFGAGVFLLHPVQTESVAYVASRSENLSVMFLLAAFAAFLCRGTGAVSWPRAAGILLLFGCAVATKEHTLVLPALLLLTDYYFNPGFASAPSAGGPEQSAGGALSGIRRNWRLYLPVAAGAALGGAFVMRVLATSQSAGFGVKGITWYEYFFTQCRAIFVYLRLVVLPYGQMIDYDFAISRTIWQHGAVFGLAALTAISAAAWLYRRRWPLASFGWFAFLLLLAPTSSFVPIQDPLAERRLYLPMIGLLAIALEFLRRWNVSRKALAGGMAGVLLVAAVLTYNRNQVWTGAIALWEDTVRKAPRNARAHIHLGYAYYTANRCADAVATYRKAYGLRGPSYDLMVDWALAHDCLNQPEEALLRLKEAVALTNDAHGHSLIGMIYAKQSRWQEALDALATAEKINPAYAMTYVYRGGVRLAQNDAAAAAAEYRRALQLEPQNPVAAQALLQAERRLRAR